MACIDTLALTRDGRFSDHNMTKTVQFHCLSNSDHKWVIPLLVIVPKTNSLYKRSNDLEIKEKQKETFPVYQKGKNIPQIWSFRQRKEPRPRKI
jgi:hypothetical protein